MPGESTHSDPYQFRPELGGVVPMAQAAVLAQTPAVQLPAGGDGCTVRAATGDVPDPLGLQCLDQSGLVTVPTVCEDDSKPLALCI